MNSSYQHSDILIEDFDDIQNHFDLTKWQTLNQKRILITGASGFMGSYLCQFLCYLSKSLKLNLKIYCVTRNRQKISKSLWYKKFKENIKIITVDLNELKIRALPEFDLCFYCASNASPIFYRNNPIETIKPNVLGLINVLEQASESAQIVFISSGEVYGNQPSVMLDEENFGNINPLEVRSCYGESKRMGENICISYYFQKNLDIRILRPFHTYGPGLSKSDGRVFADFIHAAASNNPLTLTSNGLSKRPFCYISDFISALFYVYFKGSSGEAYNVSNPSQEISIKGLASLVHKIIGMPQSRIKFSKPNKDYVRSPISKQKVSIKKLMSLGWIPNIDISYGFERSIRFERINYE